MKERTTQSNSHGRTNVIYQLNVDDPATYAAAWSDFAGATSRLETFHIYHQSLHMALTRERMSLTMFIVLLAKHYLTSHSQWKALMYFYSESAALGRL